MIEHNPEDEYKPLKIPERQPLQAGREDQKPQPIQLSFAETDQLSFAETDQAISLVNDLFCEFEYEPQPVEGAGRFVAKPHKIEPPENDAIRDLFYRMREVARQTRSVYVDFSRFFDRRVQQDSANVFYEQAIFMKDFTDDYPDQVPFSSYFPQYQMMGYEQLRTYFTWRTQVREGLVKPTSLSLVFLYIYELLNNVGVDSPEDGLARLVSLWTAVRSHDHSIDKYVLRWFKDYHIYYPLPHTFQDFIEEHQLSESYPSLADPEDTFGLFCSLSKYDIRKSVFFTAETSSMITGCFAFVIERIRQDFAAAGIPFDDALFHPVKKLKPWKPFRDALFHPWFQQPDRRVILSETELYICSKNEWTFSTVLTTEKGRQFIGYLFKQMESVLRKVTKHKFQITANLAMVNQETLNRLTKSGLFIDKIIKSAVIDFYRETTKTVVTVDHGSLARIRQEALATQEALIVEDQAEQARQSERAALAEQARQPERAALAGQERQSEPEPQTEQGLFADPADTEPALVSDMWESLRDILSESELQALAVILQGADIRQFADDHQVMLEVLADGINDKSMDTIGDNLLDEDLAIYQDYQIHVKGMVER